MSYYKRGCEPQNKRYILVAEDDSDIYKDTKTNEILSDYLILERLNEQEETIQKLRLDLGIVDENHTDRPLRNDEVVSLLNNQNKRIIKLEEELGMIKLTKNKRLDDTLLRDNIKDLFKEYRHFSKTFTEKCIIDKIWMDVVNAINDSYR